MPRRRENDDLHQAVELVEDHFNDDEAAASLSEESSKGWSTNHGNESLDMTLKYASDSCSDEEESSDPESDDADEESSSSDEEEGEEEEQEEEEENEEEDEDESSKSESGAEDSDSDNSSGEKSEDEDENSTEGESQSENASSSENDDGTSSKASDEIDWQAEKEKRGKLLEKQSATYDIENPPEFRTISPILRANADRQLPSDTPGSPITESTPVKLPDTETTPVQGVVRIESPKPKRSKKHISRIAKKAIGQKASQPPNTDTKRGSDNNVTAADSKKPSKDTKPMRKGASSPSRQRDENASSGDHTHRLSPHQQVSLRMKSLSRNKRSSKRDASPSKSQLPTTIGLISNDDDPSSNESSNESSNDTDGMSARSSKLHSRRENSQRDPTQVRRIATNSIQGPAKHARRLSAASNCSNHSRSMSISSAGSRSSSRSFVSPNKQSHRSSTQVGRSSTKNGEATAKHVRRLSAASSCSNQSRSMSISSAGSRSSRSYVSPLKKNMLESSSNHSRNSGKPARLLLAAPPSKTSPSKARASPTNRRGSNTEEQHPIFITFDTSPRQSPSNRSVKRAKRKSKVKSPKQVKATKPTMVALEDRSDGSLDNSNSHSELSLRSRSNRSRSRHRQKGTHIPRVALNDSDSSGFSGSPDSREKVHNSNDTASRSDDGSDGDNDPEFDITEVDDDGGEQTLYERYPEPRQEQYLTECKRNRRGKPRKRLGVCLALLFIMIVLLLFCVTAGIIFQDAGKRRRGDVLPMPEKNQVSSPSSAPTKTVECNGLGNLCDIRVSQLLFATVNPMFLEVVAPQLRRRTQGKSSGLRERQLVEEALSLGYRSLEIQLSFCSGEVRLGDCEDWLEPQYFLNEVDRHLDTNPNEFLFVIVDADANIPLDRISWILSDSNQLASKLYYHFGANHPWPTLKTLFSLRRQATVIVKTRREACNSCSPPLNLWNDLVYESSVDFGKLDVDDASFCPAFVRSNPSSLVALSATNLCDGSMTASVLLDLRLGACKGTQLQPTFLFNPSSTHCQHLLDSANESNMGLVATKTQAVRVNIRLVGIANSLDLRSRMQFEEECRAVFVLSRKAANTVDCAIVSMDVGESTGLEMVVEISEDDADEALTVERAEEVIQENSQSWMLELQNPFTGGPFVSMTDILVVRESVSGSQITTTPSPSSTDVGTPPTEAPTLATPLPTEASTGGGVSLGDWLADPPTNPKPSRNRNALKEELVLLLGEDRFGNPDNPYSRALDWIIEDDLMALDETSSALIQRYTAAYLYFATTRAEPWVSCGPSDAAEDPIECVYKYQAEAQVIFELPGKRWLSEVSECQWVGVTCNSQGSIFKIELCMYHSDGSPRTFLTSSATAGMQMNGWFPGGLSLLPNLQTLKMMNGALAGPLHASTFTNFANLKVLDVSNNNLNGQLPETISSARNLETLVVAGNEIAGNIPATFSNLTLKTLDLSDNKIQGTLPAELFRSTSLVSINLSRNQLAGALDPALGSLSMLEEFVISENEFSGLIPAELYSLTNLKYLDLSSNRFAGSLDALLGQLVNLTHLRIQNNVLRGAVPVAILNLVNLREAILSGNTFFGAIPIEMCALRSPFGLRTLQADCSQGNGFPEITCECCSVCCDSNGENCVEV